ncbi:MAG: hypothetical protein EXQ84_03225 [Rhodospirillaceae bacterium]|nr:hypothetical protein [Rhodospirillaceae bacterium]
MRKSSRMLVLGGIALVSVGVIADTIPTVQIPDSYFLGQAPRSPAIGAETAKTAAAVEKPQAVNGALYAVIAPTYNGTGGTNSYIRLFNGGAATATFSVTVQGSPSGNTYGTRGTLIQVPTRAAPQYILSSILSLAGAGALTGGDVSYSLYLQSVEPTAGYQHVIFNGVNRFFENVSSCTYLLNQTIRSVVNSVVLTNVHTQVIAAYPSQIEIHNYLNATTTYTATVIEAGTGTIKGQFNIPIAANASYAMPFSFFASSVGWTPVGAEQHANIVLTNPNGALPAIVMGQSIVSQDFQGALISMSTACAVNAPVVAATGGGDAGGGITY